MRGLFDLISGAQTVDIQPESWHAIGNDGYDHMQKLDELLNELLDLHRAATPVPDQSA